MTPIPFDLPRRLPPAVAYAAGLICQHRSDLSNGVRAAVLGDDAVTALDVLTLARVEADDEQGSRALAYLREIVHYAGNDPKSLHGLANVFGLLPWSTAKHDGQQWNNGTVWWRQTKDDLWHEIMWLPNDVMFEPAPAPETMFGHIPIGHAFLLKTGVLGVCGLPFANFRNHAMTLRGSRAFCCYLREGFAVVYAASKSDGAREALRRLIPIHAHTVSLDPAARAAWAKTHLGALVTQ